MVILIDSRSKFPRPTKCSSAQRMSTSLSAYEQERLKNIAANKAALVALGIEQDVASIRTLKTQARTVKGSAINKKKKASSVPPRTKSLRQQNLDILPEVYPFSPQHPTNSFLC